MPGSYPGTAQHQALLNCIVNHYQDDDRVLAVCLFGSLVRGNWDEYSDLDLDIIVADGTEIHIIPEMKALGAAFQTLGERVLILVPSDLDEGDMVLQSLMELSIRYHTLATTSPNIIDHLQLLTGKVTLETIQAAGAANRTASQSISAHDIDRFLRWAVEVNIRVRRRHLWQAVQLLAYMRSTLIEIFAFSRGYSRAYHAFDAEASGLIRDSLGATLPRYSLESIQSALSAMLDIIETDLDMLSSGRLQLSDAQHVMVTKVRERIQTTRS